MGERTLASPAHGLSLVVDIGVAERSVEGSDQLGSSGGSWIRSASPAAGFRTAVASRLNRSREWMSGVEARQEEMRPSRGEMT